MSLQNIIKKNIFKLYKNIEIKLHELRYLFLEITKKCNLQCLHCGSDCSASYNSPQLTTESWLSIIDYIHYYFGNDVFLVISGGEPLVHNDLEKIIKKIFSKNFRWGIVTNGYLLDENKINMFFDNGIESISISLDGDEYSHDKLRNKKGCYKRVVNAINLLGKSKIPIKDAVTCVFSDNINILNKIGDFLVENNFNSWRLYRIFNSGRVKLHPEILLSYEDVQKLLQWISENRNYYKTKGLDLSYSCEGWMNFDTDLKIRSSPFFCRAGINIAAILSNGIITGCSNNSSIFYEGSILENDFYKLWNDGFKKFRDRKWLKKGICKECKKFSDCQGSSIHLWHEGCEDIEFCYKDIKIKF